MYTTYKDIVKNHKELLDLFVLIKYETYIYIYIYLKIWCNDGVMIFSWPLHLKLMQLKTYLVKPFYSKYSFHKNLIYIFFVYTY